MGNIQLGDRVWVKQPRELAERRTGTIVAARKARGGTRYSIEWDLDLLEYENGREYSTSEITKASSRSG